MVLYCVYTQYTTSIKNTLRCLLDLCFPYISLIIASELKVLHCKHRQCKHQHFSALLLKLSATVFPPTQTINSWIGTYLSVATFFFFFFLFPHSCCMWGVAPLVSQPIQFGKARQLVDHNYNLAALSGPTWTNPAEKRLAALLCPSRHQTLGRCQIRWVISQSVSHCVFFRSPFSVLENELLPGIKKKKKGGDIYIWR